MQRRRAVPVSMTCTTASPGQPLAQRIDVARVRRDTPGCEQVVHYYNTASEIDRFCEAISRISSRDA